MSSTPTLSAFIDESGHSGANYLAPQQPLFTLACVLMKDSQSSIAEEIVRRIDAAYPQTKEVKGQLLLNSKDGQRLLAECIEGLLKSGILPLFHIWHKQFCVTAKFVETFLDPLHNLGAVSLPSGADDDRIAIAEDLLALMSQDDLSAFMVAYRAPSESSFTEVLSRWLVRLRAVGRSHLVSMLEGALDPSAMKAIVDAEVGELPSVAPSPVPPELASWSDLKQGAKISLHLPAFSQLIRVADRHAASQGMHLSVVHDEQREYRSMLHHAFSAQHASPLAPMPPTQSGKQFWVGLHSTTTFRFGKSEEIGLRLADFVAVAARAFAAAELGLLENSESLERVGCALAPMLELNIGAWAVGPSDFQRRIRRPVRLFLERHLAGKKQG